MIPCTRCPGESSRALIQRKNVLALARAVVLMMALELAQALVLALARALMMALEAGAGAGSGEGPDDGAGVCRLLLVVCCTEAVYEGFGQYCTALITNGSPASLNSLELTESAGDMSLGTIILFATFAI